MVELDGMEKIITPCYYYYLQIQTLATLETAISVWVRNFSSQ
jgi:hypothetical protein